MTRRISFLTLILSLSGIVVGCGSGKDDSPADVKPRAKVEIALARLGNIDNTVSTTGSFQVLRDEKVKSTISGKIERVFVREGDAVKRGEVLVTIMSQESNAAIEGARELMGQAKTAAAKSEAEKALKLAEGTAALAKITAPFDGAVSNRFVTEGELVNAGSDLLEMIDPQTEYFVADVPVSLLPSIRAGETAELFIPNLSGNGIRGIVESVNPATDPNSQSVPVRIGFQADRTAIPAGTFGNVRIKIGMETSVILVPKQAVYHDDELDRYLVWRIQGDSLALLTQVQIGLTDSSRIEIKSGLKPGDAIATVGGYGLPDSTAVTVVKE